MMDPEVKARWIEALESGKYKKGVGYLCNKDGQYCCLGVLADIQGHFTGTVDDRRVIDNMQSLLPGDIADHYGLNERQGENGSSLQLYLGLLNDGHDTFAEVIEYIKEHV